LNQGRFASSPDIDRGLLANLVALRTVNLENPAERELIFWVQGQSKTIGLQALAQQAAARIPSPIRKRDGATPAPDNYAGLCRRVNDTLHRNNVAAAMANLPETLARLCLDPEQPLEDRQSMGFPLIQILSQLKQEGEQRIAGSIAKTALSRAVFNEIEDAFEMGGTVLMHNASTANGKSWAAKAFCEAYPGRARYVLTPATNLETDFWRSIGAALGTASGQSFKCTQIRARAIQALKGSGLVLVLDNAHHLFPVSDYRYALPNRVNQVLDLAECGVPVVMIADTSLFSTLGFVEKRTGWSRAKFVNQINRLVELPAHLSQEDVFAVASVLLPQADRAAQRKLAGFMISAHGYLHAGRGTAERAQKLAERNGRERVSLADMEAAIEWAKPSLAQMESALSMADAAARQCQGQVRNYRPDTEAQLAAKQAPKRNQIRTSSDFQPVGSRAAAALPAPGRTSAGAQILAVPDAEPALA
jgi:hypothetical protein